MKILLVDDEVELSEPVSRVLRREGYEVDVAYDGEKGSELAAKTDYNLLILDWMLPKKNGPGNLPKSASRRALNAGVIFNSKRYH